MGIDEEDFDALETQEIVPPRRGRQAGFGCCMAACGLSTEDTMELLGLSRSAVEKKRVGSRPMTHAEGRAFSRVWHAIRTFKLDDLPDGARDMAVAMTVLSGRKAPEAAKRGRPRMVPVEGAVWMDEETMKREATRATTKLLSEIAEETAREKAKAKAERAVEMKKMLASAGG